MPTELVTAIIAGGSAIGGGMIVAASNYGINRAQANGSKRAELRRTLSAYLALLNSVDHQLRIEPEPGRFIRFVNQQMARFPQFDYTVGQTRRRLLEPHLDAIVARMNEVMADVFLLAPPELVPAIEAVNDLMTTAANAADPSWQERWQAARANLVAASRAVLRGQDPPRPGLDAGRAGRD